MASQQKYAPDVKAPRFRKDSISTVVEDVAKQIKNEVFACKSMSIKQIKRILNDYNQELFNVVINTRDGIEIPAQIGHIFLGTCPMKKRKNVDFKKSVDYMQTIQHRNWESDNYLAKIFFTSFASKYRYKNNELWGFEPGRDFKRTVGKEYPHKWKMYVEIDPHIKISSLFRSKLYNIERTEQDTEGLKTYNEFEF